MKTIRDVLEQPLLWTQPSAFQRVFELHAGDDVVGTLRWQKAFGSLALAESSDGVWSFKRSGFLRPKVTVRVPGSETECAAFKPSWGGEGVLRFSDGRCYQWQHTSIWRSEWAFVNDASKPLVHFKPELAYFKHAADVTIEPRAVSNPDLSLLTLLGWYLMVLMAEDSAAAAVVVAAGS
jgi:hypothetical protein